MEEINKLANTTGVNDNSSKDTSIAPVDEAQLVMEKRLKLKAENDMLEAEALRGERLRAQLAVAGRSVIAQPTKIETPEEKWRREAKIRYAGTGLDPT